VPPALLSRAEVIDRLLTVIRRSGYDGASLSDLSAATGLGKSSLYHHFPNGKDDMAMAVLESLAGQLRDAVFTPLRTAGTPKKRLDAMVKSVDAFYSGGDDPCILAQIALGSTRDRFRGPVKAIFADWMDAITDVLVDAKLPRAKARTRAEDAVLRIEGALILAGAMNDTSVFQRTLRTLTASLLA
jgi:TetR/AcrR family transcriptional regulator, lmrAB and yxaGH operons repressor